MQNATRRPSPKTNRTLIRRADIIAVVLILVACAATFYFYRNGSSSNIAVISVDGKVVREVALSSNDTEIIKLNTDPTVTLEVKNGTIRFISSKCPDHICEKAGALKNKGDTAACIPAKTVVTIKGKESKSPDGLSY